MRARQQDEMTEALIWRNANGDCVGSKTTLHFAIADRGLKELSLLRRRGLGPYQSTPTTPC